MENDKVNRILSIYNRLLDGKVIYKKEEANNFGVNEKSIQRDIEDIREFLDSNTVETGMQNTLIYNYDKQGYCLERINRMKFSNEEVLAVAKILLDSRAFTKQEMMDMLDKLIVCCVPKENQKLVESLIANEKIHYIPPRHGKVFLDKMWEIGRAINESRYIEIKYEKINHQTVTRKVQPQAIMFSEFYFYLVAYIENIDKEKEFAVQNDVYPTIYRIDRIAELSVLEQHFKIPYKNRFEEGEYRKRIQFMYGGKLQKTMFWYKGKSVEAVLDRLPTAQIITEDDGKYLISAETFGEGINMWLRSQGEQIEIVNHEIKNADGLV